MKLLALYSIKGGVGKTAMAASLAHAAAGAGLRTLLVDLDAQGASSYYFRVRPRRKAKAHRLLAGGRKRTAAAIRETDYPGLDILPAHLSFRKFERELLAAKKPRTGLRRLLRPRGEDYDLVILDCPPNLSLVAENVFRVADLILVPVIPTTLSHRTYELLRDHFKDQGLDRDRLLGFFSLVDRRKTLHRDVMATLPSRKRPFCTTVVPYCTEIERMGIHRAPVGDFAPASTGGRAVAALWAEVRDRLGL